MAIFSSSVAVRVAGTAVAFTNEATTLLTANTVYQITDTTKRILDPSAAITVEVDADGAGAGAYVVAAADTYTVDYLFGKITFAADQGASALVRVSGSYLPVHSVAESRSVSINSSRTELEKTVLGDTDKSFLLGLKSAEGELEGLFIGTDDLDSGAGSLVLQTLHDDGTPKLLEVAMGSVYWRGWVLLKGINRSTPLDDLVSTTVGWRTAAQKGLNRTDYAGHGIGS